MNNILKFLTLAAGFLFLIPSCSKEEPFPWDGDGTKSGSVSFRKMMVEVNTSETVVRGTEADVAQFLVEIAATGTGDVKYSGTYAALPEILTLPVGDYKVVVKSPENPGAAFDSPYHQGSQSFKVTENEVTYVDPVVCRLANVKVSVKFDPALLAVMADDCTVTVEAGTGHTLVFGKNETRSGYFRHAPGEGTPTMVATFRGTVEDNPEENLRTYTDVAPGNHYIITYTLHSPSGEKPEVTGTITPGVSVDATVEVEDMNVNIDVEDDTIPDTDRPQQGDPSDPNPPTPPVTDKNPPTVVATINGTTDYTSPFEVTGGAVEVKVKVDSEAEGGIKTFTVDIDSTTLTEETLGEVGLAKHLDLVNPGAFADALQGLGFPINVGGMTDVPEFDISTLIPLLKTLGPGDHKFVLTVGDANGTTVKTLHFVTK